MAGTVAPYIKHQFFTNAGAPAAGYYLHTFLSGTTTQVATYSNAALSVANANPIVLDASGRCTLFLTPGVAYKFELALSTDTTPPASPLWSVDAVEAIPPGSTSADADIAGTAGETLAAGECCYLADGSGGTTTGRWYRCDADAVASSTGAQPIGFCVTALSTGSSGTFRVIGRVTGLSGLTAGTLYYVSATAGALTSSAPANARVVGRADSTTTLDIIQSLPDATATLPGLVSNTAQTFAGVKTFSSAPAWQVLPTGVGGTLFGRCTTNITKNANTTFADVTGCAFAVGASETWSFRAVVFGVSAAAADFKFTFTGPASPTAVWFGTISGNDAEPNFGDAVTYDATAVDEVVVLEGFLRNGANAGTVQLQFAQNTSDASNSIVYADSYVIAQRLN